jgi:steroid 5-alpha reductase family enzyme
MRPFPPAADILDPIENEMMESPLTILALVVVGLAVAMTVAWWAERMTGNAGWIDVSWTFGIGVVGFLAAVMPPAVSPSRQWLVGAIVAVWALRLGSHIVSRTLNRSDDPRYAKLREGYGADASKQMFWLAQKQAVVSIPLAFAIYLAAHNPTPHLRMQDWIGAVVMLAALGGEAVADAQLKAFSRSPLNKRRICDAGLWAWSRHPNYFFEWLGWVAYAIIAIDVGGAYPWGWLSLAAPLIMYWLLVYVTGVAPLEEHMLVTRGETYRAYQRKTNAFFPGPQQL